MSMNSEVWHDKLPIKKVALHKCYYVNLLDVDNIFLTHTYIGYINDPTINLWYCTKSNFGSEHLKSH